MLTNKAHMKLQDLVLDNQNSSCTNSADSQMKLLFPS